MKTIENELDEERNNHLYYKLTKETEDIENSIELADYEPLQFVSNASRRKIMKEKSRDNVEKIGIEEKREILNKIIAKVQELGYQCMKTVPTLRRIYSLVDVVVFKVFPFNEFIDLILIIPIKVCNLKGELHISNEMIKYFPYNEDVNDRSVYKTLLDSYFIKLDECQALLYHELKEEGYLITYLKKFHDVEITLKKTLLRRNLSFNSGNLQIKILVEPILLCENKIGFLEKLIPFAYLKNINLHIIQTSQLAKLLEFLEQKYTLLETHNTQDSSLVSYEGVYNQLLKRIELLSVLFMGFAGMLIIMQTLQLVDILKHLLNLGCAFFGIYVITLLFFNIKFFKYKSNIQQEFSTPYHKRDLGFDETSLVLINEELSPEMMSQFVFECMGKNIYSKFITQIEENQIKERINRKQFEFKLENDTFFEKEDLDREEPENEYVAKYSSFLED
ncbi:MAG: hypothetical protein ACFFA0_05200 [Promethearchaeota archaeon]